MSGGFTWTFVTVGLCIIAAAIAIFIFVPKVKQQGSPCHAEKLHEFAEGPRIHSPGFLRLLAIPTVMLVNFSLFTIGASIGFMNATLALHVIGMILL